MGAATSQSVVEIMLKQHDKKMIKNLSHGHGLNSNNSIGINIDILHIITPFENAQKWMGKNTFHFLLLNDDNMIGEHQETRMKMPNMCPFEKKEK